MKERQWVLGLLLLSCFLTAGQGTADVIEERRALMREIADDLRAIWDGLAQGEVGFVERGAERIAAKAARMPGLFPPGSFHPPSRAEPVIRQDFHTFQILAADLKGAAEEVAALARQATLGEVQEQVPRLVQTCRQCHRSYIQPY
ncbi:MAG: c-type cytochrome [Candidatus Methylomirabilales bacterium]